MSKAQSNNMLHAVGKAQEQALYDEAHPDAIPKTEDDIHKERMKYAEEVDTQIDDLEKMNFGSKDLSAYSSMTNAHASETYKVPQSAAVQLQVR